MNNIKVTVNIAESNTQYYRIAARVSIATTVNSQVQEHAVSIHGGGLDSKTKEANRIELGWPSYGTKPTANETGTFVQALNRAILLAKRLERVGAVPLAANLEVAAVGDEIQVRQWAALNSSEDPIVQEFTVRLDAARINPRRLIHDWVRHPLFDGDRDVVQEVIFGVTEAMGIESTSSLDEPLGYARRMEERFRDAARTPQRREERKRITAEVWERIHAKHPQFLDLALHKTANE